MQFFSCCCFCMCCAHCCTACAVETFFFPRLSCRCLFFFCSFLPPPQKHLILVHILSCCCFCRCYCAHCRTALWKPFVFSSSPWLTLFLLPCLFLLSCCFVALQDCFKVHQHHHPLKPIPVRPAAQQQKHLSPAQREERQRHIKLHMQLLQHASTCEDRNCQSKNCSRMKVRLFVCVF